MSNCVDEYIAALRAAGAEAFDRDEDYTENPHDNGTAEHDYWWDGWKHKAMIRAAARIALGVA